MVAASSVFDSCLSNYKGETFSDHLAVEFIINMEKPGINNKECIEDIKSSQNLRNCEGSFDELVEAYNKDGQNIINHHDPSC